MTGTSDAHFDKTRPIVCHVLRTRYYFRTSRCSKTSDATVRNTPSLPTLVGLSFHDRENKITNNIFAHVTILHHWARGDRARLAGSTPSFKYSSAFHSHDRGGIVDVFKRPQVRPHKGELPPCQGVGVGEPHVEFPAVRPTIPV